MNLHLYVVVKTDNEKDVKEVQEELLKICPDFHFSFWREQESLVDCVEFHATAKVEEKMLKHIYDSLNNDWDGDMDDCTAYGFNTKMFDPRVYYLRMEV